MNRNVNTKGINKTPFSFFKLKLLLPFILLLLFSGVASASVVFFDDFESNNYNNWTYTAGSTIISTEKGLSSQSIEFGSVLRKDLAFPLTNIVQSNYDCKISESYRCGFAFIDDAGNQASITILFLNNSVYDWTYYENKLVISYYDNSWNFYTNVSEFDLSLYNDSNGWVNNINITKNNNILIIKVNGTLVYTYQMNNLASWFDNIQRFEMSIDQGGVVSVLDNIQVGNYTILSSYDPSGYVKDTNGNMISGATVRLYNATWQAVPSLTNSSGYWNTDIYADGTYSYNVSRIGYTTLTGSDAFTMGQTDRNFTLDPANGSIISGNVYAYPNISGSISTNEITTQLFYNSTTQEYKADLVSYWSTPYLFSPTSSGSSANTCYVDGSQLPSWFSSFWYYGCVRDKAGGVIFVDDYSPDGSQVALVIKSPWGSWAEATLSNNAFGAIGATRQAKYTIKVNTFVFAGIGTGSYYRTQFVSPSGYDTTSFTNPFLIGSPSDDYAAMPNGGGTNLDSSSYARSSQAIYVSNTGDYWNTHDPQPIPFINNISYTKVQVYASVINGLKGGTVSLFGTQIDILDLSRLSTLDYTDIIIPANTTPQWYTLTPQNIGIHSPDRIYAISMDDNTKIYDVRVVTGYNTNVTTLLAQPLKNVKVNSTIGTTTTDADGAYRITALNGSNDITYDGSTSSTYINSAWVQIPRESKIITQTAPSGSNVVYLNISATTSYIKYQKNNYSVNEYPAIEYSIANKDPSANYWLRVYKKGTEAYNYDTIYRPPSVNEGLIDYLMITPSMASSGTFETSKYYPSGNYRAILSKGDLKTPLCNLCTSDMIVGVIDADWIKTDKPSYDANETITVLGFAKTRNPTLFGIIPIEMKGYVVITPKGSPFDILATFGLNSGTMSPTGSIVGDFSFQTILNTGYYTVGLHGGDYSTYSPLSDVWAVYDFQVRSSGNLSINWVDPEGDNNGYATLYQSGAVITVQYNNVTTVDRIKIFDPQNNVVQTWLQQDYPYSGVILIKNEPESYGEWTAQIIDGSNTSHWVNATITLMPEGSTPDGGKSAFLTWKPSPAIVNQKVVLSWAVKGINSYIVEVEEAAKKNIFSQSYNSTIGSTEFTFTTVGPRKAVLKDLNGTTYMTKQINVVAATPTPTPTVPPSWGDETTIGSEAYSVAQLDNYVGTMGYGINNMTRFLFSVLVIIFIVVLVLLVSKGNTDVAVTMGFLPFTFFTLISFSEGARAAGIEFLPKWPAIMFIILVALSMKIFR